MPLFFAGCGQSAGCGWQYQAFHGGHAASNTARMFLPPANQFSGLELEFVSSACGLRLYLNVFGLEIPVNECDPTTSLVYISFKDHSYTFAAPRFQGGQRLLIPDDVRNEIIDYMQENQPIYIEVGQYQADIFPEQFLSLFKSMM